MMEKMDNLQIEMIFCCRLCGKPITTSAKVVNIYNDPKCGNSLADRINMHLPVKVTTDDNLPLFCCTRCTNTVTDFHELVFKCLETEAQLRELNWTKATFQNDSWDDHTYVDIKLHDRHDRRDECYITAENARISNIFIDRNKLFTSGATLPLFEAQSTHNLPTVHIKSVPVEKETDIILGENLLKSTSDPLQITSILLSIKTEESITAEETSTDSASLIRYPCDLCTELCYSEEEFVDHMQHAHKDHYENLELWLPSDKTVKRSSAPTLPPERTKQDKAALAAAKTFVNNKVYYKCPECAKNLCSSYTFLWHMRIHTGEKPHVCDLCGKQFRIGQGLIRHLRETHHGIKNFPCDICKRMFSSKRNVAEHRNIHTNDRPYVCDTCGKRFKQKASLFVHNRSHTNVFPFPCTYCAQTFRTGAALFAHVRRHTGEKPFVCGVCGRGFRVKYELKRHTLIHSDEKPWQCERCHLTFRQKRYLVNHCRLTHSSGVAVVQEQEEKENDDDNDGSGDREEQS